MYIIYIKPRIHAYIQSLQPFMGYSGSWSKHWGRLESSGSTGVKTLVPIRPIACVNGVLDLKEATVKSF